MSITAIGSLAPDSTSSRFPSRRGTATRRSAEKTAAASVDATTAPTSSAVVVSTSRSGAATRATTPAGDEHADRRQAERRRGDPPHVREPDAQPALVEDDDQRRDGEGLGELRVRQADQVEAVVADGHADAEEEQQARHPHPIGQPGAQHPGDQEERAPEQELVRRQLEVHTSAWHGLRTQRSRRRAGSRRRRRHAAIRLAAPPWPPRSRRAPTGPAAAAGRAAGARGRARRPSR